MESLFSSAFLLSFLLSFSMVHPLCHSNERLALLQFKESLVVDKEASVYEFAYPKTDSWKLIEGVDCCSWEGIECDNSTGHVIGLDLSSSCLSGSINSSSSLFNLVHLQKLNLADNDFSSSEIPSKMANLSMLTYLNLSSVNISSRVPAVLANLSSLMSLDLSYCRLFGEFPTSIFHLPSLQFLEVSHNLGLTGILPGNFANGQLKMLSIAFTSFFGILPASIGNLYSLEYLDVTACKFRGLIPSSLGNLTNLSYLALQNNSFSGDLPSSLSNLTQISFLSLGNHNFKLDKIPSWFANFNKLNELHLPFCGIEGPIPSFLANMSQLAVLDLKQNLFHGHFPVELTNLTKLTSLSLASNSLDGVLPNSIFRLENLELLELYSNKFSGTVELDQFLKLKYLTILYLSSNNLTVLSQTSFNDTLPMLNELGLASCNLRQFPNFLRHQKQLVYLDLSYNNIRGHIPKWIWKMEYLFLLDLSFNSLTGYHESPTPFSLPYLYLLDLSSNLFQGFPVIPSLSLMVYRASNNTLSGEIPLLFCNMTSLRVLDLSHNNLGGIFPGCLSRLGKSLSFLNLRANNFHGSIPREWTSGNKLKMLNLGQNNLQGKLPRSIAACRMLEFLDIGNNQIKDAFPFWLESLPELKILILRSNKFQGEIRSTNSNYVFPKLRVIDISNNGFIGPLPSHYFARWNAIRSLHVDHLSYMQTNLYDHMFMAGLTIPDHYNYTMTLTNKGIKLEYTKILEVFMAVDLSCNKFEGEIPESIGFLKGLQLLNLSNNILVGEIPPVIGTLTKLEALDLSQNKLVGRIPWQLKGLNFLEVFNVSHNHLSGPIPQGNQFDTFPYNSFDGNLGLCGNPISKKCEDSEASPTPSSTLEEDQGLVALEWKGVLLGFGCGFLIGSAIGYIVVIRNLNWFAKFFRMRLPRRRRG